GRGAVPGLGRGALDDRRQRGGGRRPLRPMNEARALGTRDLTEGDWISFDAQLTAEDVDAFAALTGDHSPIHVSADHARRAGFRDRVVHGMLMASLLSTVVGMYLPGRRALLMAQKTDFLEPVTVGARVTVTAR